MNHFIAQYQVQLLRDFVIKVKDVVVSFKQGEILTLQGDNYKTVDNRKISIMLVNQHTSAFARIVTTHPRKA